MRKVAPVRWRLVFALALVVICSLPVVSMVALPAIAAPPTSLTAPRLNVPIPGLDFTKYPSFYNGTKGTITIPFLSAYINFVYQYLLGISIVTAAVMIVYGGFQYIVGSSIAKVGRAKEIISDAVIGLILILGSTLILTTIAGSSLSQLKPLEVLSVKRVPLEASYNNSLTTTVLTGTTPNAPPNQTPGVGSADAAVTDCPFALEHPLDLYTQSITKDPRNAEFFSKIKPLLEGKSFPERYKVVGDAAAACKITLGSCGSSALYLLGLASTAFAPCLTGAKCDYGFLTKNGKGIFESSADARKLLGTHCGTDKGCNPPSDCLSGAQLLPRVRDELPRIQGNNYPESWLSGLQPGDWLYVYSGNGSCTGEHSIVFNGWANEATGLARTVQGPGFKKLPDGKSIGTVVVEKDVCLSPKCGNYLPMTRVYRAKP